MVENLPGININDNARKNSMITIIGAGWYGCYLGAQLEHLGVEYQIFESESEIFQGSSSYNQNRLHLGFHYPRDHMTRKTSRYGFNRFISEYPDICKPIEKNLYAIHSYSLVDYETYKAIYGYEKYEYEIVIV